MTYAAEIAALATLDPRIMRAEAVRMSWYYRTGDPAYVPDTMHSVFGDRLPTREEWTFVRDKVHETRALTLKLSGVVVDTKATKRREYMRKYMADYRKGKRRRNWLDI